MIMNTNWSFPNIYNMVFLCWVTVVETILYSDALWVTLIIEQQETDKNRIKLFRLNTIGNEYSIFVPHITAYTVDSNTQLKSLFAAMIFYGVALRLTQNRWRMNISSDTVMKIPTCEINRHSFHNGNIDEHRIPWLSLFF